MRYTEKDDGTITIDDEFEFGVFAGVTRTQTILTGMAHFDYLQKYFDGKTGKFKQHGVVGVGTGLKYKNGKPTGEVVPCVYVEEKIRKDTIHKKDLIPSEYDVKAIGIIKADSTTFLSQHDIRNLNRRERYRPFPAGVSTGNAMITAGTVGFPCTRDGQTFFLSNAHVLCENPTKDISDQETDIYQPGPYDGGKAADNIGRLRYMVLVQEGKTNYVDAAMCLLDNPLDLHHHFADLGGLPKGIVVPFVGMEVIKSGRTTEVTTGTVTDINVTLSINFGDFTATFAQQCLATDMSAGGDSGSAILERPTHKATGQLNAGSDQVTVFQPIQNILSPLRCELLLDEDTKPPTPPDEPEGKQFEVNFTMTKDGTWGVFGTVIAYVDELPLSDAKITLSNGTEVHVTRTGYEGSYSMKGLAPGGYRISCAFEGYTPQSKLIVLTEGV